jgi:hypothetical protein
MKYYLKQQLDDLAAIEKKFPCVTVNRNHPSLLLCERIHYSDKPSVIDLTKWVGVGFEPVATLVNGLSKLNWFDPVVDSFGDVTEVKRLRRIVNCSYALVRTGRVVMDTDVLDVIGPIGDLCRQPEPQPSPAVPEE